MFGNHSEEMFQRKHCSRGWGGGAGLAHDNHGGAGGTLFEGLWTPTRSPALVLLSVKLLELSDPHARMVVKPGWSLGDREMAGLVT